MTFCTTNNSKKIKNRKQKIEKIKIKLHSNTRKLNVKTVYNVRLRYNDAPSNTIKVHI